MFRSRRTCQTKASHKIGSAHWSWHIFSTSIFVHIFWRSRSFKSNSCLRRIEQNLFKWINIENGIFCHIQSISFRLIFYWNLIVCTFASIRLLSHRYSRAKKNLKSLGSAFCWLVTCNGSSSSQNQLDWIEWKTNASNFHVIRFSSVFVMRLYVIIYAQHEWDRFNEFKYSITVKLFIIV